MESGPASPSPQDCQNKKPIPRTPTKNRTPVKNNSGCYSPHLRRCLTSGGGSPSKEKSCDRFIPTRAGAQWEKSFTLTPDTQSENGEEGREQHTYKCLLQNELLGAKIEDIRSNNDDSTKGLSRTPHKRRLFHYQSPSREPEDHGYSLSPVSRKSQKLLTSPKKSLRKIPRAPYKVLDAPDLQDDFYLNLVDWSYSNVLTVGLGASVYLWSASTSQVTRLCDLSSEGDSVTSVGWSDRTHILAVGTNRGCVQLWDAQAQKRTAVFESHELRAGALAWNGDLLCSGSRDRFIIQRDIRAPPHQFKKLTGHKQEVCGLKWSPDRQHLASGGNDNKLFVWNQSSLSPVQRYTDHVAAVKAIAWSPHQHGLLASGGGTADQYIRFWNTLTGQPLQVVHTGSQVCNLAWSKTTNEFVSTHGYSQHQILVWRYPSLQQVVCLTGHHCRVLYLAMSPDGQSIVTGAGDETLRFWNVFSKSRLQKESRSALNLFSSIR